MNDPIDITTPAAFEQACAEVDSQLGGLEEPGHTTPQATRSECRAALIDAEGSELLAEVFNRMTIEQKNSVSPEIAERIGNFMVKNGYRIVFTRWYLQAEPDKA